MSETLVVITLRGGVEPSSNFDFGGNLICLQD